MNADNADPFDSSPLCVNLRPTTFLERFKAPFTKSWAHITADERENPRDINRLTGQVLAAAFEVSNTLGAGFLEIVYRRALVRELALRGISAVSEASFTVNYQGRPVGEYYADIVVDNVLAIELKCVDRLANNHIAQCLNYLRVSHLELCLLINFQKPRLDWRRVILPARYADPAAAHDIAQGQQQQQPQPQ